MEDEFTATYQYYSSRYKPMPLLKSTIINTKIILLFVITLASGRTNALCPSRCYCNNEDLLASCSGTGLQVVPIQLNPEVKFINLTHNKINNIHFTLEIYANLITLDISFNKLYKLGVNNFVSQYRLGFLDLSHNNISFLDKDVFKGLRSLKILDLSYNNIEDVAANAFHDLHQLETLRLGNNKIISLKDNIFKHQINLKVLILDNNQFLDVPTKNLVFTSKLEILSMSQNLLKYIDKNSLPALQYLKHLMLDMNVIFDLHFNSLDDLPCLEFLNLSDNNFTTVPTTQLAKLSNLSELNLSGNFFSSIPSVAFQGLFKLRILHLNRLPHLTSIETRAFVDNIKLENITINNNLNLSVIPTRLFYGNQRILQISMVNNALTTLDASHFPFDQLYSLQLSGNPFNCNCSLIWLWKLVMKQKSVLNDTDFMLDINGISCRDPEELNGKLLFNVAESEIQCSLNWIPLATMSAVILCIIVGILSKIFYNSGSKCCMREKARPIDEISGCETIPGHQSNASVMYDHSEDYTKFSVREATVSDYYVFPQCDISVENKHNHLYRHNRYNTKGVQHSSKLHIVYV